MSLNVATVKTNLINLLTNNNTTTSGGISENLYKKVQTIRGGYAEKVPTTIYQYPAVFVEILRLSDNFSILGSSDRRNVELEIDIVPIVHFGIGQENASNESDDELLILTNNILELIRDNISLSNTVDSMEINETTYQAEYENDTYNSMARINLIIKKRS